MRAARTIAGVALTGILVGACGGSDEVATQQGLVGAEPLASLIVLQTAVEVGDDAEDDTTFLTGLTGQEVTVGEFVRTGPQGFAELSYRDGSLTRIDRGALFAVTELADTPVELDVTLQLDFGRAWNNVSQERTGQSGYRVETPVATAAVRGTTFDVDCRDVEETGCIFTVIEGVVEITTISAETVDLLEFERVTVAPDGTLGEVTTVNLFDPTQTDAWAGRNDAEDRLRRGGAAAVAGSGETGPPRVDRSQEEAPPRDQLGTTGTNQSLLQLAGDVVRQRIVVGGPSVVNLGFSYCNAQICGTSANVLCIGNKYNPTFGGVDFRTFTIAPLPGHELAVARVSTGQSPESATNTTVLDAEGTVGETSQYSAPPTVTADGGLTFTLDQTADFPQLPFSAEYNRYCGLSKAEVDSFRATWGDKAVIRNAVAVVELEWRAVTADARAQLADATQEIETNGDVKVATIPAAAVPDVTGLPVDAQDPYQATDAQWSELLVALTAPLPVTVELGSGDADALETETGEPSSAEAESTPSTASTPPSDNPEDWLGGVMGERSTTFDQVSDVPVAIANALARLDVAADPVAIGTALLQRKAWQPGGGVQLRAAGVGVTPVDVTWLAGEALSADVLAEDARGGIVARLTDVGVALDGVVNGVAAAWVVALGSDPAAASAYVLLGYDDRTDRAVVLDPRRGPIDVLLPDLLSHLQGVVEFQRAGAPSVVSMSL